MNKYFKLEVEADGGIPEHTEYFVFQEGASSSHGTWCVSVWPYFNVPEQYAEDIERASNGEFYCYCSRHEEIGEHIGDLIEIQRDDVPEHILNMLESKLLQPEE